MLDSFAEAGLDAARVQTVLGAALDRGGDWAEVFAEDVARSSAMLDDGRIEDLTSSRDRGVGVRVMVGESTGFAHTADLSEAGLVAAARAAADAARVDGPGTTKGGPYSVGAIGGSGHYGLVEVDDDGQTITVTLRAKSYDGRVLLEHDPRCTPRSLSTHRRQHLVGVGQCPVDPRSEIITEPGRIAE